VGTVPAIKKATEELPPDAAILVLATIHTAHSPYLHDLIETHSQEQQFIIVGTTELVKAIEENDTDWTTEILKQLLEKRSKETHIDGLIIGCTHFSLVENEIRSVISYPIKIFDSVDGIVKQVKKLTASP
jgi:glutamate racemase